MIGSPGVRVLNLHRDKTHRRKSLGNVKILSIDHRQDISFVVLLGGIGNLAR